MNNRTFILIFLMLNALLGNAQTGTIQIYFDFNSFDLNAGSRNKIDSLLNADTVIAVRLTGHCDSIGTNEYNDRLALKRAANVKNYFSIKSPVVKITAVNSYGKRKPIVSNEDEQSRAMNRRVEIEYTVVKKVDKEGSPIPHSIPPIITEESDDKKMISFKSDLQNTPIGETMRLPNLNFYGGRHVLLPTATETLEKLVAALKENPNLEIEIQGYICCVDVGDGVDMDTRTRDLSVNRAKAIYDYLILRGIDEKRLSYKGYGAQNKLVVERNEADMSMNRRVEVKVINK
jgi:outer membrane protein OmpA-like peptidoglycan-associated protein